jgi:5-methylcytosine-specific restriction endonuclease McrA
MTARPCGVCGSNDRFPSGPCRLCAKRRALSPDERRKYQKKWYAENREKHNERIRRYRSRNPAAVREAERRKENIRRGAVGKLSKGIEQKLLEQQAGICPCCNKELGDNYHLDHIMPLKLGGTNTDDNVQLLRAECNLKKGAKHPDEWKKFLAQK